MKRLRACKVDVNEYLAEHMMRLRRSKETLGLCMKIQCVERFKASNQYKAGQGMIMPNTNNQQVTCARCQTVVKNYDESYCCMFCNESYCPPCLGYVKYFDMAELEHLIKMDDLLKELGLTD